MGLESAAFLFGVAALIAAVIRTVSGAHQRKDQ